MLICILYGTSRAVLLWHRLLISTLLETGFKLYLNDLHEARNIISNEKNAIFYHIDYTKALHVKEKFTEDIFDTL